MEEAWTLQDLVGLLPQRMLDPSDFIRCAAVCRCWKSSFAEYRPQAKPWLMIADKRGSTIRDFYSLTDQKMVSFSLPECYRRSYFGTLYGWLLTVGLDLGIHLVNPLTRAQIPLPAADNFFDKASEDKNWMRAVFMSRVCLSSDPTESTACVVMVAYGQTRRLAFARLGRGSSTAWTDVKYVYPSFEDIIFFKGRFYAIRCCGTLVACDIDSPVPAATRIAVLPPRSDGQPWDFFTLYLVELCGAMLAVARTITSVTSKKGRFKSYHSSNFEIYRLEEEGLSGKGSLMKWARLTSIGDHAIFLGRCSSMCVPTSKEIINGIRGNCIYFADDIALVELAGIDEGVFCLQDGKIERFYQGKSPCSFGPPTWVTFSRITDL